MYKNTGEAINAGTEFLIDCVALYYVQTFSFFFLPKSHLDHVNHGTKIYCGVCFRQLFLHGNAVLVYPKVPLIISCSRW